MSHDSPAEVTLEPAKAADLEACIRLIARSKAVWPWPPGYLDAALPLLRIDQAYLASNLALTILEDGRLAGFAAFILEPPQALLDHFWIEPDRIGLGIGRRALQQMIPPVSARGIRTLLVYPDPPAEPFYQKLGFVAVGDPVPSRIAGGPQFRPFRLDLPNT